MTLDDFDTKKVSFLLNIDKVVEAQAKATTCSSDGLHTTTTHHPPPPTTHS